MMVLIFLGVLLAACILWIVFIPVKVRINTDLNQYEIGQTGTLTLSFYPWEKPFMRMTVFGFRMKSAKSEKKKRPTATAKKKKWTLRRSPSAWLFLIRGIYKSFRLKKFDCTVDLDDVVLNAKLIPLIVLLNRGAVSINTNFTNRYFLSVEIEGRINKLLWTLIRFFIKR